MARKPLPKHRMVENSDEFVSMYEANAPLIYRFMFWRTKDDILAQDLTSNVFVKAWRTRSSFNGGSIKAWLYTIARTTLIDHWRKIKEVPDDGTIIEQVVSDMAEPGEALDKSLEVTQLRNALTKLPKDMYEVVHLRFIEGRSARDVAKMVGISETNVRVMQYRALKKLRSYLQ